jgi:hypothetical protein
MALIQSDKRSFRPEVVFGALAADSVGGFFSMFSFPEVLKSRI